VITVCVLRARSRLLKLPRTRGPESARPPPTTPHVVTFHAPRTIRLFDDVIDACISLRRVIADTGAVVRGGK